MPAAVSAKPYLLRKSIIIPVRALRKDADVSFI